MSLLVRVLLPVVFVAVTGAVGVAWLAQTALQSAAERSAAATISLEFVSQTAEMSSEMTAATEDLQSVLAMTRLLDVDAVWASVSHHVGTIQKALEWMTENTKDAELLSLLDGADHHIAVWNADAAILLGQVPSSDVPTTEKVARSEMALAAALAEVSQTVQRKAEASRLAASEAFRDAVINTSMMLAAGLIVAFLVAGISARSVTRRVSGLANKLHAMADSDRGTGEATVQGNVLDMLQQAVVSLDVALKERAALEEAARKTEREQLARSKQDRERVEAENLRAAQEHREALEREAKQEERAKQSAALEREIAQVISSAQDGVLGVRIEQVFEEKSMREVASGINALLDTVAGSISEAQETLRRLAQGDLRARFDGDHKGIFAALQTDINQTARQFEDAMHEIAASSQKIFEDATGISDAASRLAHRTEQTASRSEMTTKMVENISAAAAQMAENATKSNQLVTSSLDDVKVSESSMLQAMGTMDEISRFSKEISAVVKVINDISFQTNLLALNAGVEAARAGPAGSGFAVVASEVRSLAQRSADSASEIEQLINRSAACVDDGVEVVKRTGEALKVVSTFVGEISERVFKINAEASVQSEELMRVRNSLGEIDKDTQDNASMFEQTTVASQSLTEAANMLSQLAGRFDREDQNGEELTRLSA